MYITATDITVVMQVSDVIALTDDGDIGVQNTALIESAIVQADSVIDSYLGSRYQLPLSIVPEIVKSIAVSVTVWVLCQRGAFNPTETRIKVYDDAIKFLKDIAKGVAGLGLEEKTAKNPDSSSTNKTTNDRVFTQDTLKGF
ncbi:MAG: DUF1320 domain-containing protein [Nitrospirae bacterium YQR-1]